MRFRCGPMSREELKHYVRAKYYGSTIKKLRKKDPQIYSRAGDKGLIKYFVNEGTLVDARYSLPDCFRLKSNTEIKHWMRANLYGIEHKVFFKKHAHIYNNVKARGLIDYFAEEGTIEKDRIRWEKMTREDKIDFVKKRYNGSSIADMRKTKRGKGHFTMIGREKIMPDLLDRGILRRTNPKYDYANKSLYEIVEENHKGQTLREFGKSDGTLLNRVRDEEGLLDRLTDDGIIIREKMRWKGMSDEEFINYVKSHYSGSRIEDIKNLKVYRRILWRGMMGLFVAEGVITMGRRGRKKSSSSAETPQYYATGHMNEHVDEYAKIHAAEYANKYAVGNAEKLALTYAPAQNLIPAPIPAGM